MSHDEAPDCRLRLPLSLSGRLKSRAMYQFKMLIDAIRISTCSARVMLYVSSQVVLEVPNMESTQIEKRCRLVGLVRDTSGRVRFNEQPTIVREVNNLDRHMFLVRFDDGATTFLFPHEVAVN